MTKRAFDCLKCNISVRLSCWYLFLLWIICEIPEQYFINFMVCARRHTQFLSTPLSTKDPPPPKKKYKKNHIIRSAWPRIGRFGIGLALWMRYKPTFAPLISDSPGNEELWHRRYVRRSHESSTDDVLPHRGPSPSPRCYLGNTPCGVRRRHDRWLCHRQGYPHHSKPLGHAQRPWRLANRSTGLWRYEILETQRQWPDLWLGQSPYRHPIFCR